MIGAEPEVWISRRISAPRERVFRAWTEPAMLQGWYAPHGCTLELREMDVRPGGRLHHAIHNPDYGTCWIVGTFTDVTPPQRLVYTHSFSDEAGRVLTPVDAGREAEWPSEIVTTVTFDEMDNGTRVTIHQTVSDSLAQRTGARPSWFQMLDRLVESVVSTDA